MTEEVPMIHSSTIALEAAYDAACAILANYVDPDTGEIAGLTAYQAAIRAVDVAAPLIAADAEKRGAEQATSELARRARHILEP